VKFVGKSLAQSVRHLGIAHASVAIKLSVCVMLKSIMHVLHSGIEITWQKLRLVGRPIIMLTLSIGGLRPRSGTDSIQNTNVQWTRHTKTRFDMVVDVKNLSRSMVWCVRDVVELVTGLLLSHTILPMISLTTLVRSFFVGRAIASYTLRM
jgi:hypothetical protein